MVYQIPIHSRQGAFKALPGSCSSCTQRCHARSMRLPRCFSSSKNNAIHILGKMSAGGVEIRCIPLTGKRSLLSRWNKVWFGTCSFANTSLGFPPALLLWVLTTVESNCLNSAELSCSWHFRQGSWFPLSVMWQCNVSVIAQTVFFLAPELPVYERRNWLIHLHFIRKEYDQCMVRKVNYSLFNIIITTIDLLNVHVHMIVSNQY